MQNAIGDSPLRNHLLPGETLLWAGQPDKQSYVLRGAWYMVPFSLVWGGFTIFWEYNALRMGAPLFFALWGIPFVCMGLYMIFGRFFVAARMASRTFYALTSRRILMQGGLFSRTFEEFDLSMLPYLSLKEDSTGRGTIYFAPPGLADSFNVPGWPMGSRSQPAPAFTSIDRAAEVYRLIQQARPADNPPAEQTRTFR